MLITSRFYGQQTWSLRDWKKGKVEIRCRVKSSGRSNQSLDFDNARGIQMKIIRNQLKVLRMRIEAWRALDKSANQARDLI